MLTKVKVSIVIESIDFPMIHHQLRLIIHSLNVLLLSEGCEILSRVTNTTS